MEDIMEENQTTKQPPEHPESQAFQRKNILINKKFQIKIILKASIPLLVFFVFVFISGFYGIYYLQKEIQFENTNEMIMTLSKYFGSEYTSQDLFSNMKKYMVLVLLLMFLLTLGYMIYIFVYFSHRIAGPVLRFEKTMDELLQGNLKLQIHLREKDEFKETADHFNRMMEALKSRIKRINQYNKYTRETLKEMMDNSSPENREKFQKLEDLTKGIEESIHEFKF